MTRSTLLNWLLLVAVVVLVAFPVVFVDGEFAGSDGQAEEAITESHPDYEPWFAPLYEPPSGEIESGLFALQAALGAGVVGYYFGVVRTKRRLGADRPAEAGRSADGVGPETADD
ncbi:energy-coupling factor ABC transporter substrate-binding protein [Pseudonocardia sp. KRD291]|uniref:energy-coupling factor ABC transporter substrate-binding protein n=1 Tax=Pseudonocardia sp. KRD291 TaxID=2792007 RepID=UPI001C49D863|nr:energy-coupling factor ABC transporter substrate-binding protein [Pseudonocardia sp. KRD291]MBW0101380.1 energy-coupling factor ABC transporter substrate-binding protein [Pseudonocardia sp. KRD291]